VGTATVILANAAKARIRGAEIELALRPVPPLTLSATIGLMDPKYTDFVNADIRNAPTTFVNVKGNQLAQVSKQQYALGAEWVSVVGGLRVALGTDYVWRSKFYFTEFNTPDAVQDGYGLLNFSGSIRPAKGPWKVYGYVRNATDETALTGLLIASPILGSGRQVTYTRPREYGIGATMDF
jgi:outer membrane receptor protein involved in Fe transport